MNKMLMPLMSPFSIRNDSQGGGYWGAKRTKTNQAGVRVTYCHEGIDFIVSPGDAILAPCKMRIVRMAFPYADDHRFHGIEFAGEWLRGKIFYFNPLQELIGQQVWTGNTIGFAEDLRQKYGDSITPHVHLEITSIDPLVLF